MADSKQKKNDTSLKPFIWGSIAVVIICAGVAIAIASSFPNWAERGEFGDSFGAVNALFSGLAFAGIIYTILLQRRELQLQREELELTRDELKRSADAQEKSQQELAKQLEFEAKSRQQDLMISNINDWTDKVVSSVEGYKFGKLEGVSAINSAIERLSDFYKQREVWIKGAFYDPSEVSFDSHPKVLYKSLASIISDIEAVLQYIISKEPPKELFEINLNILIGIVDAIKDIEECSLKQNILAQNGVVIPEPYSKITLININKRLDTINTF